MSMAEAVNIMGVWAYPNPNGIRDIRFIDSHYNTLFKVPDGGSVVVTRFDGNMTAMRCTYIDDFHARIGNEVYHICQFAEIMERNGATYAPEQPQEGDICDTYELYQIRDIGSVDYAFRSYEEAKAHIRR